MGFSRVHTCAENGANKIGSLDFKFKTPDLALMCAENSALLDAQRLRSLSRFFFRSRLRLLFLLPHEIIARLHKALRRILRNRIEPRAVIETEIVSRPIGHLLPNACRMRERLVSILDCHFLYIALIKACLGVRKRWVCERDQIQMRKRAVECVGLTRIQFLIRL